MEHTNNEEKRLYNQVRKQRIACLCFFLIAIIAFVSIDINLGKNWIKERRIEREKERIENEMLEEEFINQALIEIDNEYDRIDSIVSHFPKPRLRNYDECVAKVNATHWNHINCNDIECLTQYQLARKEEALSLVNDYVLKLQRIEPCCIDGLGERTTAEYTEIWVTDEITARNTNERNPKFLDLIDMRDF